MAQDVYQIRGKYYSAARAGRIFHAATAVTGVAPGTAISTTAGFALHNPFGSGVNLAILKASIGYISGTLGAGTIYHLANENPVTTTPDGTAITPVPALLNGAAPLGKPLTTATIVEPTLIRPFCSLGASLASTAEAPWRIEEDVDGAIVVPPGCTYALHGICAAGTSPLIGYGVTWEEIGVDVE